ncbi:MAG: hypothetical protein MJ175_12170 [Clostridia bacterium]|nr:hypothetical protein [Clostridia bacterium]
MKKFAVFILAALLAASMTACGSKTPAADNSTQNNGSGNSGVSQTVGMNEVEAIFHPATSSEAGAYATIKISADVQFDDTSAWLGLCPVGKDYITELEADDVDVVWFNYEGREDGDPYVFACDFSTVEDGTYALVVASSDDESVGYIMMQLEMTKKGDSVTFDYSNAKLKDRPGK